MSFRQAVGSSPPAAPARSMDDIYRCGLAYKKTSIGAPPSRQETCGPFCDARARWVYIGLEPICNEPIQPEMYESYLLQLIETLPEDKKGLYFNFWIPDKDLPLNADLTKFAEFACKNAGKHKHNRLTFVGRDGKGWVPRLSEWQERGFYTAQYFASQDNEEGHDTRGAFIRERVQFVLRVGGTQATLEPLCGQVLEDRPPGIVSTILEEIERILEVMDAKLEKRTTYDELPAFVELLKQMEKIRSVIQQGKFNREVMGPLRGNLNSYLDRVSLNDSLHRNLHGWFEVVRWGLQEDLKAVRDLFVEIANASSF